MIESAFLSSSVVLVSLFLWLVSMYLDLSRSKRALAMAPSTRSKPSVLYFYHEVCDTLAVQNHYLGILKDHYGSHFIIRRINSARDPELAVRYGVSSTPAILILNASGEIKHINYGLAGVSRLSQQLESVL